MNKELMEKLVNNMLTTGADYSEVYYENTTSKGYNYINSKLSIINTLNREGVGLRIINNDKYYYSSTNDLSCENLLKISNELKNELNGKNNSEYIKLEEKREHIPNIKIKHNSIDTDTKIEYIKKIDSIAKNYSKLISQVEVFLREENSNIQVANSNGVITNNLETRTRVFIYIYAQRDGKIVSKYARIDVQKGYEVLSEIDLEKFVIDICNDAIEKLDAIKFKGGEYPVIIESGFGALIFHEACGHALESTRISTNKSILCDKLNTKIASDKVTLIDDGSIEGLWGSKIIDDEGEFAQKNILIKNGILNSYLVDRFHSKNIKQKFNGSSRRESYLYAPTSRMSNTYIEKGNDKVEDMIKSINYGIYVKDIAYGSVKPATGDFNFFTSSAYLIEKGNISKRIEDVSIIGNCIDILNNVEMVSDNLKFEGGYCGAESGNIFITAGMPTIKVSKILIGGNNNE